MIVYYLSIIWYTPLVKTYHVDGGAKIEPPEYKFHDAYFTVVDDDKNLVYLNKELGDQTNNQAEYEAIKWVVENIAERPIRIFSDSQTAISWVTKGGKMPRINLTDVHLQHLSHNFADEYNAVYISPKYDKAYYKNRWLRYDGRARKVGNRTRKKKVRLWKKDKDRLFG